MQNRKFLILGLVSSLVLPFIYFTQQEYIEVKTSEVPFITITDFSPDENMAIEEPTNWWPIVFSFYLFVVAVMVLRFVFQLYSLQKIINSGENKSYKSLKLVKTPKDIKPFSFFNYIVFNPEKHPQKDLKLILKHEQIHAKQWHSLDVIFTSVLCIMFWFNPFIWLYKKVVVQNLEFLADQDAVATIPSKKEYQKALVTASVGMQPAMTNQFYQTFIKKRIIMLNRSKKKGSSWKMFLVIPFVCLFLYSFNVRTESVVLDSSKKTDTVKNHAISGKGIISEEDTDATKNNNQKSPIRSKAFDVLGKDVLYIVDNKFYTKNELEGKTIAFKTIEILSPQNAESTFKGKAKDGAVILSKTELIEDFQTYLKHLDKVDKEVELQFLQITSNKKPEIIFSHKENDSSITGQKKEVVTEEKGKNGKSFVTHHPAATILKDTLTVVNGKPASKKALKAINPSQIEEIIYLKNANLTTLYGARAQNGIKIIVTDHEKAQTFRKKFLKFLNNANITDEENKKIKDTTKIYLLGTTKVNNTEDGFKIDVNQTKNRPLYVINGKIATKKDLQNLQNYNINSINVLKGHAAADKYKDENTEDGVVEVYTKDFQQKSTTFVYTIHPYTTDAAIQNMISTIKKDYNIEVELKKIKRNEEGMIKSIKMKAKHRGSSYWNVSYSASDSDKIDPFYMIMNTKKDDFSITSTKPGNEK